MSIKPGYNSVLFQARRFEQYFSNGVVVYYCPLCDNGSFVFEDTSTLLQHAKVYHIAVAQHSPEGSPWKIYVYTCIQKARNPKVSASLPYHTPYLANDGPVKFSGFPPPHMQDYQYMFSHPTPSGFALNLSYLNSLSVSSDNPHVTQPPGTAIPSKRPAAHDLDSQTSASHAERSDHAGRKRTARQHKIGRNPRTQGDLLSGRTPELDTSARGGRKHRKLSKHEHRHTQQVERDLAGGHRCAECSKKNRRCERDADHDACRACLLEELDCTSVEGQSNCAQASHQARAEEDTISVSSSYCDGSPPESPSETLDDDSGPVYDDARIEVLLQPQTKPITLAQLDIEVGTIHKAVEAFELGCRDEYALKLTDARRGPEGRTIMQQEDYQKYIGRHKSFMQETHDLCLATQHPVASIPLRALPRKINVPARMWQYGIAAPLEILRMRLPESREHAVAFILIAFNMMTLFLETVPEFEATWLECIGDLARYRLGLAETDEEKEVFSSIATFWFRRALELNPQIGRLRHHLAVLVPNFSVEQLSLYGHALTAYTPFFAARKSVLASLRPVLDEGDQLQGIVPPMSLAFLRAHASLFIGGKGSLALFNASVKQLIDFLFADFVKNATREKTGLKKFGCYIAIANSAAVLEYGATTDTNRDRSIIRHAFLTRHVAKAHTQQPVKETLASLRRDTIVPGGDDVLSRLTISHACTMTFGMLKVALRRPKDENLHPMIHVSFVMIWAFCKVPEALKETQFKIPWQEIRNFLNAWANALTMTTQICSDDFPHTQPARNQALPEDFMMQGLWYTQDYLPSRWCDQANLDQQERLIEKEEYVVPRIERILWLGYGIAKITKWIGYDRDTKSFHLNVPVSYLSSNTDTYLTEPELQPLYHLDTQPVQSNWNTQPPYRPAPRTPWKEDGGGGLSPSEHTGNSRLRALAKKWAVFKQDCESFIINPPSRHDMAVRKQRQLGESIAQDFLAELDSIRREDDAAAAAAAADNSHEGNIKAAHAARTAISTQSDILKSDMQATSKRINLFSKYKKQAGIFDIYSDQS